MRGVTCFLLLLVITGIDLGLPYLVIGDIASLWASFLFWTLLTLGVIGFAVVYTRHWGRRP